MTTCYFENFSLRQNVPTVSLAILLLCFKVLFVADSRNLRLLKGKAEFFRMKQEWIKRLETFLEGQDFGKNWDGAYQDAVPTIRTYFDKQGFRTHIMPEWLSDSRDTELVAEKERLIVRIPWAEDYNGKSVVDLSSLQIH